MQRLALACVLVGTVCACGPNVEEQRARVDGVFDAIRPGIYDCPDRIWPGTSEVLRSGGQVVLTSHATGLAYVFNDLSSGSPGVVRRSERSLDVLPSPLRTLGRFATEPWQGAVTLAVSLDATEPTEPIPFAFDGAARLVLHESFHFLGPQEGWPRERRSRGTPYPSHPEQRYLRASLERELLRVVRGDPGAEIGRAAYWQARFASDHPDEAARLRTVDRIEGSAEYFEWMGSALAEVGCEASDAELDEAIVRGLDLRFLDDLDGTREPYDLGALAGVLLHRTTRRGWQREVARSATLVELALADVDEIPVPDDTTLLSVLTRRAALWNERTAARAEPFLEGRDDPSRVRVGLPDLGSFTATDIVSLTEVEGAPDIALEVRETSRRSVAGGDVEVRGAPLQLRPATPCEGDELVAMLAIVPLDVVTMDDGRIYIDEPTLRADGVDATLMEVDGLPWLCPSASP